MKTLDFTRFYWTALPSPQCWRHRIHQRGSRLCIRAFALPHSGSFIRSENLTQAFDRGQAERVLPNRKRSMHPADQANELMRKRAEHKKSQASLDALSDLEYWDLELEVRKCNEEACGVEEAMAKKLSYGDLDESVRGLAKKKAQLKAETDHI